MTAQISIKIGEKSLLPYILKPIARQVETVADTYRAVLAEAA